MARGDMVFMPLRDGGLQSQDLRRVTRRTASVDSINSRVAEELRRMLAPTGFRG